MIDASAKADLKANLTLQPQRSQVFLFALIAIAAIALILSAVTNDGALRWAFFAFAILAVLGSLWAFRKSQSDTDLASGHQTQMTLPDGGNFSTDTRLLRNPEGVRGLTEVLEVLMCRKPLPPPSGLVDGNMNPLGGSAVVAAERVEEINVRVQAATNQIIDGLGLGAREGQVISSKIDGDGPLGTS